MNSEKGVRLSELAENLKSSIAMPSRWSDVPLEEKVERLRREVRELRAMMAHMMRDARRAVEVACDHGHDAQGHVTTRVNRYGNFPEAAQVGAANSSSDPLA